MNLREWARATHRALSNQPPDERTKHMSAADVECVIRIGIDTLIKALLVGDDLRIDDLGRIWSENKSPRRIVSNLSRSSQVFTTQERIVVRFRASKRLGTLLNSGLEIDN